MATQLDAICRSSDINIGNLAKRTNLKYSDILDILDGKKTPTPHMLKTLMGGISFYTKKSFTDEQAINLLSDSAGTTHETSIMRMKGEPGLVIRDTNGTPIFESQKVARSW